MRTCYLVALGSDEFMKLHDRGRFLTVRADMEYLSYLTVFPNVYLNTFYFS